MTPARAAILRVLGVGAAAAACAGAALAAGAGTAKPKGELLPDLDQGHPRDIRLHREGPIWWLGFTSNVNNSGRGPLVIRGVRRQGSRMRAEQVISLAGGGTRVRRGVGSLRYVRASGHQHWHLLGTQRFLLLNRQGRPLPIKVRKQGLCFGDRERADRREPQPRAKPVYTGDCGGNRPGLRRVVQGISPGYADPYPANVEGQELDVTNLPAGRYVLVHRADPLRRLKESDESNNAASVAIDLKRFDDGYPVVRLVRRCPESARCSAP